MIEAQKFRGTAAWKKMRQRVLSTEDTCGMCGRPVDTTLGPGYDGSPEVDHIIPLERGGHPLDRKNLVLMHRLCNRKKGDRIVTAHERQQIIDQVTAERYRGSDEDWSDIF